MIYLTNKKINLLNQNINSLKKEISNLLHNKLIIIFNFVQKYINTKDIFKNSHINFFGFVIK